MAAGLPADSSATSSFPFTLHEEERRRGAGEDIDASDLPTNSPMGDADVANASVTAGTVHELADNPLLTQFDNVGRPPLRAAAEVSAQLRSEDGIKFMSMGKLRLLTSEDLDTGMYGRSDVQLREAVASAGAMDDDARQRVDKETRALFAALRASKLDVAERWGKPESVTASTFLMVTGRGDTATAQRQRVTVLLPWQPAFYVRATDDTGAPHARVATAAAVQRLVDGKLLQCARQEVVGRTRDADLDGEQREELAEHLGKLGGCTVTAEEWLPVDRYQPEAERWWRVHVPNTLALSRVTWFLREQVGATLAADDPRFMAQERLAALLTDLRPNGWMQLHAGERAGGAAVEMLGGRDRIMPGYNFVADGRAALKCLNVAKDAPPHTDAYRVASFDLEAWSLDTRCAENMPTHCSVDVADISALDRFHPVGKFVITRTPMTPPSDAYALIRVPPEDGVAFVQAVRRVLRAVDADVVAAHNASFDHCALQQTLRWATRRDAAVLWFPDHPSVAPPFRVVDPDTGIMDVPAEFLDPADDANARHIPWDCVRAAVALPCQARPYDQMVTQEDRIAFRDYGSEEPVPAPRDGAAAARLSFNMLALKWSVDAHNAVDAAARAPTASTVPQELPAAPPNAFAMAEVSLTAVTPATLPRKVGERIDRYILRVRTAWTSELKRQMARVTPSVLDAIASAAKRWVAQLWHKVAHTLRGRSSDPLLAVWVRSAMQRLGMRPMPKAVDADFLHALPEPCGFTMSMPSSKQAGARLKIRFRMDAPTIEMDTQVISKKKRPSESASLKSVAAYLGIVAKKDMKYTVLTDILAAAARCGSDWFAGASDTRLAAPRDPAGARAAVVAALRNVAVYNVFDSAIVTLALHKLSIVGECAVVSWLGYNEGLGDAINRGVTVSCFGTCIAALFKAGLIPTKPTSDYNPEWGLQGATVLPTKVGYYGPVDVDADGADLTLFDKDKHRGAEEEADGDDDPLDDTTAVVTETLTEEEDGVWAVSAAAPAAAPAAPAAAADRGPGLRRPRRARRLLRTDKAVRGKYQISLDVDSLYPTRGCEDNLGFETRIRDEGFPFRGKWYKGGEAVALLKTLGVDHKMFEFHRKAFTMTQFTEGNPYARQSALSAMWSDLLTQRKHVRKVLMAAVKKEKKAHEAALRALGEGEDAEAQALRDKVAACELRLKVLEKRQLGLKLLANAMYGYLSFPDSDLPAIDIANMVTSGGRETIQEMKRGIEEFSPERIKAKARSLAAKVGLDEDFIVDVLLGHQEATGERAPRMQVLAGDTDSVLVLLGMWADCATDSHATRCRIRWLGWLLGDWVITEVVRERFNQRAHEGKCPAFVGIKIEYISNRSLFAAMKNYALAFWEEACKRLEDVEIVYGDDKCTYKQKGMASVKRSTPKILSEEEDAALRALQKQGGGGGLRPSVAEVDRACLAIMRGKVPTAKFAECVMLGNPTAVGKHTAAWNRMRQRAARGELPDGYTVPMVGDPIYLVKRRALPHERDVGVTALFEPPEMIDHLPEFEVDTTYYLELFANMLDNLSAHAVRHLGNRARAYALKASSMETRARFHRVDLTTGETSTARVEDMRDSELRVSMHDVDRRKLDKLSVKKKALKARMRGTLALSAAAGAPTAGPDAAHITSVGEVAEARKRKAAPAAPAAMKNSKGKTMSLAGALVSRSAKMKNKGTRRPRDDLLI